LKKLGAPTNAQGLGVENEDVIKALKRATSIRPERYTILNKLNLRRESYEHLARVTEVI
jgi:glycerol-1-phosphate dehydrogenase [NAD(P)+]